MGVAGLAFVALFSGIVSLLMWIISMVFGTMSGMYQCRGIPD